MRGCRHKDLRYGILDDTLQEILIAIVSVTDHYILFKCFS
jgi:hypothetical protein